MKKAAPGHGIHTLEEARAFVLETGICGIFSDAKGAMASLWNAVDLPHRQPGEKGWGEKVTVIWTWKNELPLRWPDEIFYGKTKGGLAVLLSMDYLRTQHYPRHHRPPDQCSALAQKIYGILRLDPMTTKHLREELAITHPPARNQLDRALQELQVTLNIVRRHGPATETDTWVPFFEQYSF
ncbi:MAG TPA: hypothetical protein VIT91_05885 [Chthoniobacterales bacterium]